jgi:hypothetical protein
MADGQNLLLTRERHAVLADDAAAAHDGEADLAFRPGAGQAVPRGLDDVLQVDAATARGRLAEHQGRAAGGVDLAFVVGLEHLDVEVAGVERPGRPFDQPQQQVDAQGEAARPHDGDAL